MLRFHSHAGWANRAVDLLVVDLIEFKAFTLFSLTFGIGMAVQAERAKLRGVRVELFLVRRLLVLLAFGLFHLLLISNVDILILYAICGLLVIPLLRLPGAVLALAGLAAVYLPSALPLGSWPPAESVLREHAANATRIYSEGGFATILTFRWRETVELIAPLLVSVAQRTFGMMLLGVALWYSGVVRDPQRYRFLLWVVCLGAGAVGLVNSTASVLSDSMGKPVKVASWLKVLGSHAPLAFAYAAALLAWPRSKRPSVVAMSVAAAGRMALTNYLVQSLVLAVLFYGYGFGLFGRLAPAPAAALGVALYAGQLAFSLWWLRRHRFGAVEWLWRSMTYGRRQPMRLPVAHSASIPHAHDFH
jgi:uncharacterized protein